MARQSRIVIPGAPHHVTLRANNKRRLFSYACEYHRFLYFLGRAQVATSCSMHALVLMTNHVHLVVTPPDVKALSEFVKLLSQRYAQTRNQRRGGSGHLFEERFNSVPITSERQLALTTAYDDLNPVRAGMTARPDEYAWSTYALHTNQVSSIPRGLWTPTHWYLELGATPDARAVGYRKWIDACLERDERPHEVTRVDAKLALANASPFGAKRPDGTSAR